MKTGAENITVTGLYTCVIDNLLPIEVIGFGLIGKLAHGMHASLGWAQTRYLPVRALVVKARAGDWLSYFLSLY